MLKKIVSCFSFHSTFYCQNKIDTECSLPGERWIICVCVCVRARFSNQIYALAMTHVSSSYSPFRQYRNGLQTKQQEENKTKKFCWKIVRIDLICYYQNIYATIFFATFVSLNFILFIDLIFGLNPFYSAVLCWLEFCTKFCQLWFLQRTHAECRLLVFITKLQQTICAGHILPLHRYHDWFKNFLDLWQVQKLLPIFCCRFICILFEQFKRFRRRIYASPF